MEATGHIILFSALDWGLGHTTRSIPLLTYFNKKGAQLLIAVQPGSASEKMLQKHFPTATFLPLQGYNITYAKKRKFFALKIISQIPKILSAIGREHRFVKNIARSYPVKLILSDNRYGFYHKSIHSVFMTHQLRIAAPFRWLESVIQRLNYSYIQRFDELWIPDLKDALNIGGTLSHPQKMPANIPAYYLGPLSRLPFQQTPVKDSCTDPPVPPFKYLFLLSGPEPQRSLLEKRLLEAASQLTGTVVLVRGLPARQDQGIPPAPGRSTGTPELTLTPAGSVTVIPYADPATLTALLQAAQYVVCRSGYSTVMDLLLLGKKGIYIPTPGQTEQQYLGRRLMQQHWGICFEQETPDYAGIIQQADGFNFSLPELSTLQKQAGQHIEAMLGRLLN